MKAEFLDYQDVTNPLNGAVLETREELTQLFDSTRGRRPFLAELVGDNGFKLIMGWSDTEGCVQFSSVNGMPPYLMAVGDAGQLGLGELEFLAGDTPTPMWRKFLLPMWRVKNIAIAFVETGQRAPEVNWEEV